MIHAATLLFAVSLASSGTAGTQFDLVCAGVKGQGADLSQQWSARYAVDLGAMAYCEAPCTAPKPIARIEPGMLWLIDARTVENRDVTLPALFINRVSGDLKAQDEWGVHFQGTCETADFTPFPKARF